MQSFGSTLDLHLRPGGVVLSKTTTPDPTGLGANGPASRPTTHGRVVSDRDLGQQAISSRCSTWWISRLPCGSRVRDVRRPQFAQCGGSVERGLRLPAAACKSVKLSPGGRCTRTRCGPTTARASRRARMSDRRGVAYTGTNSDNNGHHRCCPEKCVPAARVKAVTPSSTGSGRATAANGTRRRTSARKSPVPERWRVTL